MKRYLFTPGPTPVPPPVLAAMGEPVVHHRSPDFKPIYERCLTRLRDVCRTQPDDVRGRLREREARAVWIVHSETSTGVVADVQGIAAAAGEAGALVVVDA